MAQEISSRPDVCLTIHFPFYHFPSTFLPRPIHLPILCSGHFPGPFHTTMSVLLTLTIVIVIGISMTAPSTAWRSGIHTVLIIIILMDRLIQIQRSQGQEVALLVLPAAWWLNHCPEVLVTVPRDTHSGAFIHPRAGCLQIGAIDWIPEDTGVLLPANVHVVGRFIKHSTYIWAECCPPVPKRRTPAPVVRSH